MANLYVDQGLYNTPITGGTVPTESEDGNGKGTGKASMATLVLNFTGQPTASQAVTIAGVTFTAVASGATGNQFNIGASASATASNLATAINASTTNATKPLGIIAATAPLRNIVNATVSGSVVTVYTRISGTEWNSVTETSTLSNVTVTQWSGGTDGAYGYLVNVSAIFPTSRAASTYGVLANGTQYLNNINAGDIVNIRSGKTITLTTNTTYTFTFPTVGTVNDPVIFKVDNSTIWADGSNPILLFSSNSTNSSGAIVVTSNSTATYCLLEAMEYGTGDKSLQFYLTSTATSSNISLTLKSSVRIKNVSFRCDNNAYNVINNNNGTAVVYNRSSTLENCNFITEKNMSNAFTNVSLGSGHTWLKNCIIRYTGAAVPHTGLLSLTSNYYNSFTFVGCKFEGFRIGSKLCTTTLNTTSGIHLYDCDLGDITNLGPNYINTTIPVPTSMAKIEQGSVGLTISTKLKKRDFVIDNPLGFIQWNSTLNFPYISSTLLLDGASDNTPWSIQIIPSTLDGNISPINPLSTPAISKINSLSTGTRTITLEYGIEKNISFDASKVWMEVEYQDSSDIYRRESTYDYTKSALTSSTTAWSSDTNDGGVTRFTYSNGGTLYFNKYKFSLTTTYSIKTNTEISVTFYVGASVLDTSKMLFVDPDFGVV